MRSKGPGQDPPASREPSEPKNQDVQIYGLASPQWEPKVVIADPKVLEAFAESGLRAMIGGLRPMPVEVPPRLTEAFRFLHVEPVLVGGSAVQVWTGEREGIFQTGDLDFITHISKMDLVKAGIEVEPSGRHALVDGIPIEFPSGPLGAGDLILDPKQDTLLVPTTDGAVVRCIRPEACALDRLGQVVGWGERSAYLQALAVAVVQSDNPGWDWAWGDDAAKKAGLSKVWAHFRTDIARGETSPESMEAALKLGLG